MGWQDEMVPVLRIMAGDYDGTAYTTPNLELVICVSALQVSNEMAFTVPYESSVVNVTITPDPTYAGDPVTAVGSTRDENFINLCCMKAACIIDRGEARVAAKQGLVAKDGQSSVDLRGIMEGKIRLLEKGGWCKVYADAKFEYMAGQARLVGAAILTPFRVYANGGGFFTQVPGRERDVLY